MKPKMEETWKSCIEKEPETHRQSALEIARAVDAAGLNPEGMLPTDVLYIPKVFDREDKAVFESIVDTMMPIFYKTIDAYKKYPAVRALFPFDAELQDLIALPVPYGHTIPICRIDIFYDEDSRAFKFCEFNTDGTSTMYDNMVLADLLDKNAAYVEMGKPGRTMELVDTWIDTFLANAKEAGVDKPVVAITDFLENAWFPELLGFEKRFRQRGIDCDVVDIRDFDYDGKHLFSKKTGKVYTAVYRRAVTGDIMKDRDLVRPFIAAVKDGNVLLEGPFSTDIPHHKAITMALFDPALQKYFTEAENAFLAAHQPKTLKLTEDVIGEVQDKDKWILKPEDSYGSKGVVCGRDVNLDEWNAALKDAVGCDCIVQEFVTPPKTVNIEPDKDLDFHDYSNMLGLYIYNGKFAGIYSRLAQGNVISSQNNRKVAPSLFLD